jgi:hypothetical protein
MTQTLLFKAVQNPQKVIRKLKIQVEHSLEDWSRAIAQQASLAQTVNQKEIRVVGLRRTGNHALITWIQKQEKGTVRHLNNLIPFENPYRYKYEHLRDYYPEHLKAAEQYHQEALGNFVSKDCLLYSYEDHSLAQITSSRFERKHDLYLGKSGKRYDLLILRDPFNLFASRLKNHYLDVSAPGKTMADLWIDYAREFLGETHYLSHNKICVNYNTWATDASYRQALAEQLNLEFTDAGINEVGTWGGGSSFEGQSFKGNAQAMQITSRWQHFMQNETYRRLLDNPKLLEYSERIFGHIPGTEALL